MRRKFLLMYSIYSLSKNRTISHKGWNIGIMCIFMKQSQQQLLVPAVWGRQAHRMYLQNKGLELLFWKDTLHHYRPICDISYHWLHEPRDHVVTPSFKPASLNPKTASCTLYELHLFYLLCASQKGTKICRNVFPVVHAISLWIHLCFTIPSHSEDNISWQIDGFWTCFHFFSPFPIY